MPTTGIDWNDDFFGFEISPKKTETKNDDKLKDILQAVEPILVEYSQNGTEKAYARKILARLRKALNVSDEANDKRTRKKVSRSR